jgi:hypothetical protein
VCDQLRIVPYERGGRSASSLPSRESASESESDPDADADDEEEEGPPGMSPDSSSRRSACGREARVMSEECRVERRV